MQKIMLITVLITALLFGSITLSGCSDVEYMKELKLMLNGKNIAQETTIITKNNDFYIPIQILCNSINATFRYIPYKNKISISITTDSITPNQRIGEVNLSMFFDKDIVSLNGGNRKADKKPFMDEEIIYIPICYTMKLLGYNIERKNNSEITILHAENPIKKKIEDGEDVFYVYYEYDDMGNLIKETDIDGSYFLYEYNNNGKLIKESTNSFGDVIEKTYLYNENGGFAEEHCDDIDGSYFYRFDNNGNRIYEKSTAYDTSYTEYIYDSEGRLISKERKVNDEIVNKTIYEYSKLTITECVIDKNGDEVISIWDHNNNLLMTFLPDALKTINYYEEENSIEIITNKEKGKWTYDGENHLIKKEFVGGFYNYIYLYEYDEFGNLLVQREDSGDEKIRNEYNKHGNIVKEIINNSVKKYKYDQYDRLIYIESYNSDGVNRKEEYIYK